MIATIGLDAIEHLLEELANKTKVSLASLEIDVGDARVDWNEVLGAIGELVPDKRVLLHGRRGSGLRATWLADRNALRFERQAPIPGASVDMDTSRAGQPWRLGRKASTSRAAPPAPPDPEYVWVIDEVQPDGHATARRVNLQDRIRGAARPERSQLH